MEQIYNFFILAKWFLFCGITDNSKTVSFLESSVLFTLRHVFFFRIHYVVIRICYFHSSLRMETIQLGNF